MIERPSPRKTRRRGTDNPKTPNATSAHELDLDANWWPRIIQSARRIKPRVGYMLLKMETSAK